MRFFFLVLLVVNLTACATRPTRQAEKVLSNPQDLSTNASLNVPFVKQKDYFCGPASLSMLLQYQGINISMDELAPQMMTKNAKGSFPSDVVSTVRRNKMLAVPVKDFRSMLEEIQGGNPVMVFENRGIDSLPMWHYEVITGFDLKKKIIIKHSGEDKNAKEKFYDFEYAWQKGEYWAIVVIKPGSLSITGDDLDHALSAAVLEQSGNIEEAKASYEAMLHNWPTSLPALIGLSNLAYARKDFKTAMNHLSEAVKHHPRSAIAWHNLATVQGENKLITEARESAKEAMKYVDASWKSKFQISLEPWL